MNPLILLCCIFISLHSLPLFSEESKEAPPTELVDLISTPIHPGEGALIFASENEQEIINLGTQSGIYGVGLLMKGSWFAEPFKKNLAQAFIIQISLGTLKSKLEGKVPQFGVLTLVSSEIPKETTAFVLPEAGKSPSKKQSEARILFMSPKTQITQNDQEKLQNTFFGKTGGVTLTPVGENKEVSVRTKERKVFFKSQKMKLDFQTTLGTPFNGMEKKLIGSVTFPVYTPFGTAAEALAMKLGNSLEGIIPPTPTHTKANRKITGLKTNSSQK